uniref:Uncharacterized protein n=1 Tax=Sphaerodactylus townsendi TaxID=933632 RepID=A0ACB8FPG3_9SAUR
MQSLGYCCGRKLEFSPQTFLRLLSWQTASVQSHLDATYYSHQNRPAFKRKNDTLDPEQFVECMKECGKNASDLCNFHNEIIWPLALSVTVASRKQDELGERIDSLLEGYQPQGLVLSWKTE